MQTQLRRQSNPPLWHRSIPTTTSMLLSYLRQPTVPGPIRVSAELGELHGLWATVVGAGIAPEGWIPETEARKARRRLLKSVATGEKCGMVVSWVLFGCNCVVLL